ncbi:class I SAM-dependent DNA methyltransferase [Streptomyces sp. NPDC052042]|uniref:class I SAM-dependent DNA methyltransferase n=1 Tax=Streptomyces sp. NPDC052042 TaxID=3365683 RepID=UPI0037D98D07
MNNRLIERVESHSYRDLFLKDLHWSAPAHRRPVVLTTDEGESIAAENVSSHKGVCVWVCAQRPGSALEAQLDQLIAQQSVDRLIIFHDGNEQVWRWPVRRSTGSGTTTRLSSHRHTTGQENPNFAHRLESIRIDWNQPPDATGLIAQVRQAFDVEAQNETRQASKLMARMYASLESCGTSEHEISVSLARILFLMFGDDTDMWQAGLFQRFIATHTEPDASDLAPRLNELFTWLDRADEDRGPAPEHLRGFKYVNGGIFNEPITLPALKPEFRDTVLEACQRDWATVSPAIFGSMFQSVRDAKTRRELGEHYTSEENILKTLNPLFLDELRAEFEATKSKKNEKLALTRLRDRIGRLKFLDPACGCGNFIIIAYRELRDLELRIMERLQELTGSNQMLLANLGLKVTLDNFYGIEIDEWPAKIAETAMFLMDRQADLKLIERLGWAPDRLPIRRQATITVSNAARHDWSLLVEPGPDVIVAGNPPFIGQYTKTAEQIADAKHAWGARYDGYLDYATVWHAKVMEYFKGSPGQFAFVTTNSITQGQAVPALFEALQHDGWRIKFAHRTFAWTSEAAGKAAVHCVIIGFAKAGREGRKGQRLFDYPDVGGDPIETPVVNGINSYLIDGPDLLVRKRSKPISAQVPPVVYGSKPTDGGGLIVEPGDRDKVVADPIAARYVRTYLGADELTQAKDRWCLWLEGADPADLAASPVLAARLNSVREKRQESSKAQTRALAASPQLFAENRQPEVPYLAIPAHVSEARRYFTAARFGADVICGNANFLTPDEDGFLFGLISSSMFMTWQRAIGGRIKSDLRFSNTIVWNNLPLPWTPPDLRQEIIEKGRGVISVRQLAPHKSLAEHYKVTAMDADLVAAHDALDAVVDKAFGASRMCRTEAERQSILFRRYHELTG